MTYTAFSLRGPRIAIAVSRDLLQWERLGLAKFDPVGNIALTSTTKTRSCSPDPVPGPSGELGLALLHRPYFSGEEHQETLRLGEERKPISVAKASGCPLAPYCSMMTQKN